MKQSDIIYGGIDATFIFAMFIGTCFDAYSCFYNITHAARTAYEAPLARRRRVLLLLSVFPVLYGLTSMPTRVTSVIHQQRPPANASPNYTCHT